MRPMQLVVWGLGQHALNKIIPAILQTSGINLYGVCSRNWVSVNLCTIEMKCKGWTDSSSMLSDPSVDIVYVSTPIGLHYLHGKKVLLAGKHLWCEKPLTSKLEETLDLLELAISRKLSLCEGYMYLYHPQFHQLLDYVDDGILGKILSVKCRFGIPNIVNPGFRVDPNLGGGAFLDVGCYPISAVLQLFPNNPYEVKYSCIRTASGQKIDTGGETILYFQNDATVYLEWRINSSYQNEIDVWGTNGSISTQKIFSKHNNYVPFFVIKNNKGDEKIEPSISSDHFQLMLQHFLNTIDNLAKAESERLHIARRAEAVSKIFAVSQLQ